MEIPFLLALKQSPAAELLEILLPVIVCFTRNITDYTDQPFFPEVQD